MRVTDADVHACIKTILSDKKAYATSLNYAVDYCKAGLDMTGYTLKVQVLYILNNITRWRHKDAKGIRNILKLYTKQKGE
jgi:hypothetical protein